MTRETEQTPRDPDRGRGTRESLARQIEELEAENRELREALRAIESKSLPLYLGDDAAKGRALAVIAKWAADPSSVPEGVIA